MEKIFYDHPLKLLVTILDRGQGVHASDIFRSHQLHFDYVCLGMGTASSDILDYFGLAETEKDVVLTLSPMAKVPHLMHEVEEKLRLSRPGHGIFFSIPLSSVSHQVPHVLCKESYFTDEQLKEGENMVNKSENDLIVCIVNRGNTDRVMGAAKEAGARGGTVLHARRVGYEDADNFFGFTIQPEKEIIAILTPRRDKLPIMKAINKVAGLMSDCHGIVFSLPVEDLTGLTPPQKTEE